MVKLNYFTKEQVDRKNKVLQKRKKVKGLAKKVFGFWRANNSIFEGNICLNTTIRFLDYSNIGTINVENNSMLLHNKDYQEKAEKFAKAYQERFMDDEKEFVINATYSK